MVASPQIAIIVPVFNEEGNVLPLAKEIGAAMNTVESSYELLFVDDASVDETSERIIAAGRLNNRVRGLRHIRNAGQSAAVWTGIQATSSPVLVTLDGDLQNDPADLPMLIEALRDCDFVCGVRRERQDNWMRRVSARVARTARHSVLREDFSDTGCGFRAFKREALNGVFPFNGMHRFLPVLVHANGARTKQVPIRHRPRIAGESKYGVWDRLGRGIYDLIAISWYLKRRLPGVRTEHLISKPVDETLQPDPSNLLP